MSNYNYGSHYVGIAPTEGQRVASAVLARMVKSAEAKTNAAIEALELDFSQYTNAELDTIKTAAQAERRRRWLATMGKDPT